MCIYIYMYIYIYVYIYMYIYIYIFNCQIPHMGVSCFSFVGTLFGMVLPGQPT